MAEEPEQQCPRCHQATFDFEHLDEGEKLVCRECGFVLDEVVLVHQRTFDDDGALQHTHVHVTAEDDGRMAGGMLLGGSAPRDLRAGGSSVLANYKDLLEGGLSFLQLPEHIKAAARQLLPMVVDAYRQAEPRMLMSPATVAAVIYLAARENQRACSLGAAGQALTAHGLDVSRECRRIVQVLEREMEPPSIDAIVVHTASLALTQFVPNLGGSLRHQPVVVKALDLTQLLRTVAATDGLNPWNAAAAILSICLAEHFKDASPRDYAKQVAAHLGQKEQTVQQHIRTFGKDLTPLLSFLPYAMEAGVDVGVQVVRNAKTLQKLQQLSQKTHPP